MAEDVIAQRQKSLVSFFWLVGSIESRGEAVGGRFGPLVPTCCSKQSYLVGETESVCFVVLDTQDMLELLFPRECENKEPKQQTK